MEHPIYRTATASSPSELDEKINALLAEGFGLYGPPYGVRNEQGFPTFCQAMTKDNEAGRRIGFTAGTR